MGIPNLKFRSHWEPWRRFYLFKLLRDTCVTFLKRHANPPNLPCRHKMNRVALFHKFYCYQLHPTTSHPMRSSHHAYMLSSPGSPPHTQNRCFSQFILCTNCHGLELPCLWPCPENKPFQTSPAPLSPALYYCFLCVCSSSYLLLIEVLFAHICLCSTVLLY